MLLTAEPVGRSRKSNVRHDPLPGLEPHHRHIRYSGLKKLILVRKETMVEELTILFTHHVYSAWGMPKDIVSDRDSKFTSTEWTNSCNNNFITQSISTSHHSKTDG